MVHTQKSSLAECRGQNNENRSLVSGHDRLWLWVELLTLILASTILIRTTECPSVDQWVSLSIFSSRSESGEGERQSGTCTNNPASALFSKLRFYLVKFGISMGPMVANSVALGHWFCLRNTRIMRIRTALFQEAPLLLPNHYNHAFSMSRPEHSHIIGWVLCELSRKLVNPYPHRTLTPDRLDLFVAIGSGHPRGWAEANAYATLPHFEPIHPQVRPPCEVPSPLLG